MIFNTKQAVVLRPEPVEVEGDYSIRDYNHWPLMIMWEMGKEKEVNHTADMMPFGIIPWRVDVHTRLEAALNKPIPFLRASKSL